MSGVRGGALVLASHLLRYPGDGYIHELRAFVELVRQLRREVTPALLAFVDDSSGRSTEAMQELYTQTFDMTPDCALEVGWHLFGEDYARGAFLVDMRNRLREKGLDEGTELPDHLPTLLALVTRLDGKEADTLVKTALIPAIDRILIGLRKSASPFESTLDAVRAVLATGVWGVREAQHV